MIVYFCRLDTLLIQWTKQSIVEINITFDDDKLFNKIF